MIHDFEYMQGPFLYYFGFCRFAPYDRRGCLKKMKQYPV